LDPLRAGVDCVSQRGCEGGEGVDTCCTVCRNFSDHSLCLRHQHSQPPWKCVTVGVPLPHRGQMLPTVKGCSRLRNRPGCDSRWTQEGRSLESGVLTLVDFLLINSWQKNRRSEINEIWLPLFTTLPSIPLCLGQGISSERKCLLLMEVTTLPTQPRPVSLK
jgi:hypothetical protein